MKRVFELGNYIPDESFVKSFKKEYLEEHIYEDIVHNHGDLDAGYTYNLKINDILQTPYNGVFSDHSAPSDFQRGFFRNVSWHEDKHCVKKWIFVYILDDGGLDVTLTLGRNNGDKISLKTGSLILFNGHLLHQVRVKGHKEELVTALLFDSNLPDKNGSFIEAELFKRTDIT